MSLILSGSGTIGGLAVGGVNGAQSIVNAPTGTIAAVTVQAAINEIVSDQAGSGGAALVGYLPSGTGAVARTVQGRLRESVTLADFGGVADGNIAAGTGTENHVQLQAAVDSLGGSGTVEIGPGVYKIGLTVNVPSGVTITGAGNYVTFLMVSNSFPLATGVLRSSGIGGAPTVFENLAVVAQNGGAAAGAVGINSAANGTITRNVWVSGFPINVLLANSDNFFLDSASETTPAGGVGIQITSTDVTVANCVLYQCTTAVLVQSAVYVDGTISISNCRALACAQNGFYIASSSNVQISNCSVGHNNNGAFTVSGLAIVNSSNVAVSNFIARLGTRSTTAPGIWANTNSSNISITNSQISNFKHGIEFAGVVVGTITGSNCSLNNGAGIYAHGGDQIIISNNVCRQNGVGGTVNDAGIYTDNSANYALYSVNGNICTQTGTIQGYGIYANVTNSGGASGLTNLVGNITQFNVLANILSVGLVASVYQTGNQ
jgi:hypothetical protein